MIVSIYSVTPFLLPNVMNHQTSTHSATQPRRMTCPFPWRTLNRPSSDDSGAWCVCVWVETIWLLCAWWSAGPKITGELQSSSNCSVWRCASASYSGDPCSGTPKFVANKGFRLQILVSLTCSFLPIDKL